MESIKAFFLKESVRTHIESAFHTFVAGFIIEIAPHLSNIDMINFEKAAIGAILLAGLRAGLKALIQSVVAQMKK